MLQGKFALCQQLWAGWQVCLREGQQFGSGLVSKEQTQVQGKADMISAPLTQQPCVSVVLGTVFPDLKVGTNLLWDMPRITSQGSRFVIAAPAYNCKLMGGMSSRNKKKTTKQNKPQSFSIFKLWEGNITFIPKCCSQELVIALILRTLRIRDTSFLSWRANN